MTPLLTRVVVWLVVVCASPWVIAWAAPSDPMIGAPIAGECHNLTSVELEADSEGTSPLDCSLAHTAKAIGAYQIPDGWDWGSVSGATKYQFILNRCLPDFRVALGGTEASRHWSALSVAWFVPTAEEVSAGARWMSCYVYLPRGSGLANLPSDTLPLAPPPIARAIKLCLNGAELTVPCSIAHTYRTTGTVTFTGAWPGDNALRSMAYDKCAAKVTTDVYYVFWVDKFHWKAGDKTVRCLSKVST